MAIGADLRGSLPPGDHTPCRDRARPDAIVRPARAVADDGRRPKLARRPAPLEHGEGGPEAALDPSLAARGLDAERRRLRLLARGGLPGERPGVLEGSADREDHEADSREQEGDTDHDHE